MCANAQTNYDHWKSPPFFDDRRKPGMECMDSYGTSAMGTPALYNVLSTRPNLNMLTTYTTLMDVEAGTLEGYPQRCPFPCTPW